MPSVPLPTTPPAWGPEKAFQPGGKPNWALAWAGAGPETGADCGSEIEALDDVLLVSRDGGP